MITWLKCQLSGDVLHLCECDNTVYVIYPANIIYEFDPIIMLWVFSFMFLTLEYL